MSWDFRKEVRRKGIHLLSAGFVIVFVLASDFWGKKIALFLLTALLLLLLEIDYVRVELRRKIPFVWRLWRRREENRFGGQVFFLIGTIISLAVFDFPIALAAILMTTFGDMAAALIGKRFGHVYVTKERSLEGIVGEFIVNFFIGAIIITNFWIVLVMSLTATIVESAVDRLDDNLLIPLFAGFSGQVSVVVLHALGIPCL